MPIKKAGCTHFLSLSDISHSATPLPARGQVAEFRNLRLSQARAQKSKTRLLSLHLNHSLARLTTFY
ncbi:hypothetical protein [Oscillatoria sp. FACHB-1406]|uniref:hypothetical protein n=1 Tax=Oscillatoria sp. FACHB-1406 TaxID=2692846 RepID=UPI0016882C49|nr:hypothetical protein [Oscillatoria sp. FACHB-1406]MBD2576402.1 hypothetical protein [Oscillatoria sp. FACHB-1406]